MKCPNCNFKMKRNFCTHCGYMTNGNFINTKKLQEEVTTKYQDVYEFYMWTQYEFLNEYFALKKYANSKNILIMGDIPIYLAYDSVECYKYPELFQFDENHNPTRVAGCPPDC